MTGLVLGIDRGEALVEDQEGASRSKRRGMAMRWRWPTDNRMRARPHRLIACGRRAMNRRLGAAGGAAQLVQRRRACRGGVVLDGAVEEYVSCCTMAICARRSSRVSARYVAAADGMRPRWDRRSAGQSRDRGLGRSRSPHESDALARRHRELSARGRAAAAG